MNPSEPTREENPCNRKAATFGAGLGAPEDLGGASLLVGP